MTHTFHVSALQDVSLLPQTALALPSRFRWRGTAIASLSTVFNDINPKK